VQDPVILEPDGRKTSIWTRSAKRCQEASLDDQGKLEDCTISSKELCRLAKKRSIIQSGRLRVPKGITHERHQEVQGQGKVGTKICRSFPNSISQGRSGLLTEATTITIRCA
jgi:hypothetical protein